MSAVGTMLRDLESTIQRGSGHERAEILARLTDLFLATAIHMDEEQVGVFDVVIGRLSRVIELHARIELAERLASIPNAPNGVIHQLALDEIAVARPVLIQSPRLSDQDLVAISAAKGRDHMLAITERPNLGEPVTDFLILRGGRVVTHAVASNQTARFSRHGMGVLVMRAVQDDALQATLGMRRDIPAELSEQLIRAAKNSARKRLNESLALALVDEIDDAVERGAEALVADGQMPSELGPISAALTEIKELNEAGQLDEAKVRALAQSGATEHATCALAVLAQLSLPAAEQIILGSDREAVLLVARGLGWSWETTAALISLRKDLGKSEAAIERARDSFRNLAQSTAQRVLGFLRMRDARP
ncbi:DUF2336 domain-containing protein [Bosea sp. SSUT16]|uniref:DUF2336 domain-containing protein n=1 Tax=Bosea spartocytisi TaxID=2773451 RepID=A0A927E6Z5_9HYPH|nr:DUF2336 domain-containing protein [Bosea spartocytisi]MBD3845513.1 DUF2336 domain-containing protein [Bosea spartocytisi]MCT4472684.1 DUF2336 domain-containing protein [Bosea spartocytisi]